MTVSEKQTQMCLLSVYSFVAFQLTQSQKQLSYLTATTECITVHSSNDGFPGGWLDIFGRVGHVSPYQGDVAPPLKEVLAIVGGKVPVLHLLDISSSCKCLKYESLLDIHIFSSLFTLSILIIVHLMYITFSLPVSTIAPMAGSLSMSFRALKKWL